MVDANCEQHGNSLIFFVVSLKGCNFIVLGKMPAEIREKIISFQNSLRLFLLFGDRGSSVVKVLCYKSGGRWFDSRWCNWNFSLT